MKELENLIELSEALYEYIDTIPKDIELPTMPGFDRDVGEQYIKDAKKYLSTIVQQPLLGSAETASPKSCVSCVSFRNGCPYEENISEPCEEYIHT